MGLFDLFRSKSGGRKRSVAPSTHGPAARAARSAQDNSLSSAAHAWVRGLPVSLRPLELCNVYPRIANRIAAAWDDVAQTNEVFNDLLVDHRGGRKGFPSPIAAELLRLQALHERRLTEQPAQAGNSGR